MSTILISKNVIDYLLTAAMVLGPAGNDPQANLPVYLQENDWRYPPKKPFDTMGQELHMRNVESYWYTYANGRNRVTPDKYVFARHGLGLEKDFDPVQVLKTLDFYEYQSDDDEKISDTTVSKFLEWMRRSWVRRLPGYEEAEWGAPTGVPRLVRGDK